MIKANIFSLLVLCLAFYVSNTFAEKSVCQGNRQVVSFDGKKIPLEPSGLVYDKKNDIFIGVSDNLDVLKEIHAEGYVIFWFKDTGAQTLLAHPLLTDEQANHYNLYDLEGLTANAEGNFYTIGSLALHPSKANRDTWFRYQGYQFKIRKIDEGTFNAYALDWISANNRRDLREWVISLKQLPWTLEHIQGRAETEGGINVEALSITPENNLLLGFRGPLFSKKNTWETMAVEITIPSADKPPQYIKNYRLPNVDNQKYGFRALTPVPGYSGWYGLILGETGTESCFFQTMLWNPKTGEIKSRQMQPEKIGIVWEGLAFKEVVSKDNKQYINAAIIDDLHACFKSFQIPLN